MLVVTAKYVSARMRATSSLRMSIVIRLGDGNGSGGGRNDGWKPPTLSRKFASSPNATSSPISPSSVMNRMRDSYSAAKK